VIATLRPFLTLSGFLSVNTGFDPNLLSSAIGRDCLTSLNLDLPFGFRIDRRAEAFPSNLLSGKNVSKVSTSSLLGLPRSIDQATI
jgi:hypothetical protein